MTLWLGTHFLLAGLVLASSAPTNEECGPLTTPEALTDPSTLFGKLYFIAGYTDDSFVSNILNKTDSSWVEISAFPEDPQKLNMFEANKMSGTCFKSNITLTIKGNMATASATNFTSDFHKLPGCDGCFTLSINTTIRNLDHLLKEMRLDIEGTSDDITARSVYLLANKTSVQESDLELFKKQASCLGFTRDPDYQYDPEKAFCREDEGVDLAV